MTGGGLNHIYSVQCQDLTPNSDPQLCESDAARETPPDRRHIPISLSHTCLLCTDSSWANDPRILRGALNLPPNAGRSLFRWVYDKEVAIRSGGIVNAEGLGNGCIVSRASCPRCEGETPSTRRGQDGRDTAIAKLRLTMPPRSFLFALPQSRRTPILLFHSLPAKSLACFLFQRVESCQTCIFERLACLRR